jgi:hypothetical protein
MGKGGGKAMTEAQLRELSVRAIEAANKPGIVEFVIAKDMSPWYWAYAQADDFLPPILRDSHLGRPDAGTVLEQIVSSHVTSMPADGPINGCGP